MLQQEMPVCGLAGEAGEGNEREDYAEVYIMSGYRSFLKHLSK